MMKFFFLILFLSSHAIAELQICPRMPIATAVSHQWVSAINAAGQTTLSQPAFTDISGSVAASQMPALTGDVTTSAGAVATTIGSNIVTNAKAAQMAAQTLKGNSTGATANASDLTIPAVSSLLPAPTWETILTGSGTYNVMYAFFVSAANATVGATYTHNSVTYTVYATITSANLIYLSGSAAPLSSGTLTKATGTGDATIAFNSQAAPKSLEVEFCGAGGGGGGSGTSPGAGGTGGNTTFGTSLLTGNGGAGGGASSAGINSGGTGGGTTISAPALGAPITGNSGNSSAPIATNGISGIGGASPFFGGAPRGVENGVGVAGITNSGAGGSGGGNSVNYGGGGGAGGCGRGLITTPNISATYAYSIGTAGSAGAGTGGNAGGVGGTGRVNIKSSF